MGTGFFPGVKRPGSGVDHPPTSSVEVKEWVELYHYTSGPSWPLLGCFLFTKWIGAIDRLYKGNKFTAYAEKLLGIKGLSNADISSEGVRSLSSLCGEECEADYKRHCVSSESIIMLVKYFIRFFFFFFFLLLLLLLGSQYNLPPFPTPWPMPTCFFTPKLTYHKR